jgi:hypothetical protein
MGSLERAFSWARFSRGKAVQMKSDVHFTRKPHVLGSRTFLPLERAARTGCLHSRTPYILTQSKIKKSIQKMAIGPPLLTRF